MKFRFEYLFVLVGLALLAGGGLWYEFEVRRPATWPRVEALVVASRVINPGGPSDYTPEITLRYESGGTVREPVIVPSWQSSSYDMVRSHVDQYPAGSRIPVAINPDDPDDARYQIGAVGMNLFGPAIFTTLGLVFSGIGLIVGRWNPMRARRRAQLGDFRTHAEFGPTRDHALTNAIKMARLVGQLFFGVGIVILAFGIALLWNDMKMVEEWPSVEATVVQARVVPAGSTGEQGGSEALFDTEVTFSYVVNDQTYENRTTYGRATTSEAAAARRVAEYEVGSSQVIQVMPGDPNIIRFDLDGAGAFVLSAAIIAMGLLFMTIGGAVWRLSRSGAMRVRSPIDIEREDAEADRFRPRV